MQLEFYLSVAFPTRLYRNEELIYHLSSSLLNVLTQLSDAMHR